MTLVTDILGRAARQCSVNAPSSWLTANDPTSLEILDFLDQTQSDIRDRVDVVGPMAKSVTITGTGVENYALPSDMVRLQRGEFSVYERLRIRRACVPISDDGQWQYLSELGTTGAERFYRLQGYVGAWTIGFQRPLDTGLEVVVSYVSNEWIVNGSSKKAELTDASDASMLPRELVEAGIVYRFRQRKGLEYGDALSRYEIQLARYLNDSRSIRKVNFGPKGARSFRDIPLPDYIPSA